MNGTPEPKEAFPYKPPSKEIRDKYQHIFILKKPLDDRLLKLFFDKLVASIALLLSSPILLVLRIAYFVECLILPENKGPMFFSYNAVSGGKIFPKYKIRLIKTSYIDQEGAAKGDWIAFSAEWSPESRTYVGRFVKKFYLDELPQFYLSLIHI